jgi:hypothetical protein
MAPTTKHAVGLEATANAPSTGGGAFILTLCRLEAPVAIRPPQNPQLARFKFFMSRSRHGDGNERLHLHMGYFPTRAEAEKCAQIMRARYPEATVMALPPGLARSGTQTGSSTGGQPAPEPPVLRGIAAAEAGALTDTQVLQILETRRLQPDPRNGRPQERPEISLLRPDDTHTRRALKAAVVEGTPVSFVVQLCVSDRPIKLDSVPALDIFRAYRLYLAEGTHEGRPWYALRLGFFGDAMSAKQVAHYARTNYATVAVVPIDEGERAEAAQKPIPPTLLAPPLERSIDEVLAADQASNAPENTPPRQPAVTAPRKPPAIPNRATTAPKERRKDSLEQTLELLAASELWSNSDSDSLSETGVRHLKVEVQKRSSRGS